MNFNANNKQYVIKSIYLLFKLDLTTAKKMLVKFCCQPTTKKTTFSCTELRKIMHTKTICIVYTFIH